MIARFTLVLCSSLLALPAAAEVVTKQISYRDNGTVMQGMVAWDDAVSGERPGILVVHEWWGQNDYARERARMLAELGYTALAVDMYGEGKTTEHPDEAGKFAQAVGGNMPVAKARFDAALAALKAEPTVDDADIAAIGYCFGGGIVLNMARMGTDIDGVVSYHGSLATENPADEGDINTEILVFNGAEDPMVTDGQVASFKQEMDAAGADYTFVNYPGAVHSFTNPGADAAGEKYDLPLAYDEAADRDSWAKTQAFFEEIFTGD